MQHLAALAREVSAVHGRDAGTPAAALASSRNKLARAIDDADLARFAHHKHYSYWYRLFDRRAADLLEADDGAGYGRAHAELEAVRTGMHGFLRAKSDGTNPSFQLYSRHADAFGATAGALAGELAATDAPEVADELLRRWHPALANAYSNLRGASSALARMEEQHRLK